MEHAGQTHTAPFSTTKRIVIAMMDLLAIHTVDAVKSFSVSKSIKCHWNQCAWELDIYLLFCFSKLVFGRVIPKKMKKLFTVKQIKDIKLFGRIDFRGAHWVEFSISEKFRFIIRILCFKWKILQLRRVPIHLAASTLYARSAMKLVPVDVYRNIMVIHTLSVDLNAY